MTTKVQCTKCGVLILPATVARNAGRCAPCSRGARPAGSAAQTPRARAPADECEVLFRALLERKLRDGLGSLTPTERAFFSTAAFMSDAHCGAVQLCFEFPEIVRSAREGFQAMGLEWVVQLIDEAETLLEEEATEPTSTGAAESRHEGRLAALTDVLVERSDELHDRIEEHARESGLLARVDGSR